MNQYQDNIYAALGGDKTAVNKTVDIQTDDELHEYVKRAVGIDIPRKKVCENHVAPFTAFADAFFRRSIVAIWKASRGYGGKTTLLAALTFAEMTALGSFNTLLGGSAEQSARAHEYITGEDTNLPNSFWANPSAPHDLLITDPTRRRIKLINGGGSQVLTASKTSVRGPHPQRLRMDEADEVKLEIADAALGQPMEARGIQAHTVFSSTHQYANGTMTAKLKEAAEKGWPVYEWCYRESMQPHGWLSKAEVEAKKLTVTKNTWDVEYELQTPNPGSRAISPKHIEKMFDKDLGEFVGEVNEYIEIETPDPNGEYVHGADWARKQDYTIIITFRIDVEPMKLVAFLRVNKRPWPVMVKHFDNRIRRYGGQGVHDGTGLGDVVDGYLTEEAEGFIMSGKPRADLLSEYIAAIERGEIVCPLIHFMKTEHELASVDDVYGSGANVHLPDSLSAGAFAYRGIGAGLGVYF